MDERGSDWDIAVGEIVAPHGLKGEVKVRLLTDFPDQLSRLSDICLISPEGQAKLYILKSIRFYRDFAFIFFEEVNTREEAEKLRGWEIRIRRDMCVPLPEGHYYLFEIIGLEVFDSSGHSLGRVQEILRTGSNDVYVTEKVLIPATRETVERVDLEKGKIIVGSSEGLLGV